MNWQVFIMGLFFSFSMLSCMDQEEDLMDRYVNLEQPRYYGDSVRMYRIQKIHKKLYKKHPDNLIYFGNLFQMNCSLGKYKENAELVNHKMFKKETGLNPEIYKNFYMALNAYREDKDSDYRQYLNLLLKENLDHNPLLGYIAARCTKNKELAEKYFPEMLQYIKYMDERDTILYMIESDKCERFLDLYRGICPACEICNNRYAI